MKKETSIKYDDGKDTVVTAISLIVIVLQSLIIIFGFIYRWDWLAYECAAMLIIPAAIVLGYGIKAIIHADQMMSASIKAAEKEGANDKTEN